MNTTSCPCCGRALPKAKTIQTVDPATLSEKGLFAYYKRTAPVENVRFQLRLRTLTPDVRAGYEALLETLTANAGKATPATNREYLRLQELWRMTPDTVTIPAGRSGWTIRRAA